MLALVGSAISAPSATSKTPCEDPAHAVPLAACDPCPSPTAGLSGTLHEDCSQHGTILCHLFGRKKRRTMDYSKAKALCQPVCLLDVLDPLCRIPTQRMTCQLPPAKPGDALPARTQARKTPRRASLSKSRRSPVLHKRQELWASTWWRLQFVNGVLYPLCSDIS